MQFYLVLKVEKTKGKSQKKNEKNVAYGKNIWMGEVVKFVSTK